MIVYFEKRHKSLSYRILSAFIAFTFIFSLVLPPGYAQLIPASPAGGPQTLLNLPAPGAMVTASPAFTPALINGITIHPENPLQFDFIVNTGDSKLTGQELTKEANKLIKYFLAALTVPEKELWVNLSPHEKDRIIPPGFGNTEMGRDLLAQDYILKQLTASLMYPEKELGKKFWDKIYKQAREKYGTTEIPMDTFNKVWIVPEDAVIYEQDNSAFVIKSRLAVMLEEDYKAMNSNVGAPLVGARDKAGTSPAPTENNISTSIIREVILPEIEKEVNTGETFASLRQIYNSTILAAWYKMTLKESLLGQVYVDQNKTRGIDTQDKQANEKIYSQYLEAFKKGVYNYIKEDYDEAAQEVIPRKYFSGGANLTLTEATNVSAKPALSRFRRGTNGVLDIIALGGSLAAGGISSAGAEAMIASGLTDSSYVRFVTDLKEFSPKADQDYYSKLSGQISSGAVFNPSAPVSSPVTLEENINRVIEYTGRMHNLSNTAKRYMRKYLIAAVGDARNENKADEIFKNAMDNLTKEDYGSHFTGDVLRNSPRGIGHRRVIGLLFLTARKTLQPGSEFSFTALGRWQYDIAVDSFLPQGNRYRITKYSDDTRRDLGLDKEASPSPVSSSPVTLQEAKQKFLKEMNKLMAFSRGGSFYRGIFSSRLKEGFPREYKELSRLSKGFGELYTRRNWIDIKSYEGRKRSLEDLEKSFIPWAIYMSMAVNDLIPRMTNKHRKTALRIYAQHLDEFLESTYQMLDLASGYHMPYTQVVASLDAHPNYAFNVVGQGDVFVAPERIDVFRDYDSARIFTRDVPNDDLPGSGVSKVVFTIARRLLEQAHVDSSTEEIAKIVDKAVAETSASSPVEMVVEKGKTVSFRPDTIEDDITVEYSSNDTDFAGGLGGIFSPIVRIGKFRALWTITSRLGDKFTFLENGTPHLFDTEGRRIDNSLEKDAVIKIVLENNLVTITNLAVAQVTVRASSPLSAEEGARRIDDLFGSLREMGGFRVPEVVAGWMEAAGIDFARYAEGGKIYDNGSFNAGENISLWIGGSRAVVMTKDNLQNMTRELIERDPDSAGNFLEEIEGAVAHFQTRALIRGRIDSLVEQQEELMQKIEGTRGVIAGIEEKIREKEIRISKLSQEERVALQMKKEDWNKALAEMSGLAADLRGAEKELAEVRGQSRSPVSSPMVKGEKVDLEGVEFGRNVLIENRSGERVNLAQMGSEFFPQTLDGRPLIEDTRILIVKKEDAVTARAASPIMQKGGFTRNLVLAVGLGFLTCVGGCGQVTPVVVSPPIWEEATTDVAKMSPEQLVIVVRDETAYWPNRREAAQRLFALGDEEGMDTVRAALVWPSIAALNVAEFTYDAQINYRRLQALGWDVVGESLVENLQNPGADTNTRKWSALLIGQLAPFGRGFPVLAAVFENKEHVYEWWHDAEAQTGLQRLFERQGVNTVVGYFIYAANADGKVNEKVRLAALRAAAHIPLEGTAIEVSDENQDGSTQDDFDRFIDQLIEFTLHDNNSEIRRAIAAEGLGKMGDAGQQRQIKDRALAPLTDTLLNDTNSQVRESAAYALGELGSKLAIPMLEVALDYDHDANVREAAWEAINKIASSSPVAGEIKELSPSSAREEIDGVAGLIRLASEKRKFEGAPDAVALAGTLKYEGKQMRFEDGFLVSFNGGPILKQRTPLRGSAEQPEIFNVNGNPPVHFTADTAYLEIQGDSGRLLRLAKNGKAEPDAGFQASYVSREQFEMEKAFSVPQDLKDVGRLAEEINRLAHGAGINGDAVREKDGNLSIVDPQGFSSRAVGRTLAFHLGIWKKDSSNPAVQKAAADLLGKMGIETSGVKAQGEQGGPVSSPVGVATGMMGDEDGKEALMAFVEKTLAEDSAGYLLTEDVIRGLTHILIQRKHETPETLETLLSAIKFIVDKYSDVVLFSPADLNTAMKDVKNRYDSQYWETVRQLFEKIGEEAPDGEFTETFEQFTDIIESYLRSSGSSSPVSKEEGARRIDDLFESLREMGGFRVPEVVVGWMEAAGIDFARYAEGGKVYVNESFEPGANIVLRLGGNRAIVMTKDNLQNMTRDLIERDPDTAGNFLKETESAVVHFQARASVRDRIDSLVEQQEELMQKIEGTRGVIAGIEEEIREKESKIKELSQEERAELQNEKEAWKKALREMSGLVADLRNTEKALAEVREKSKRTSSPVGAEGQGMDRQEALKTLEDIINSRRKSTGLKDTEINEETLFRDVVVNPMMKEKVLKEFAKALGIDLLPDTSKILTIGDAADLASSPVGISRREVEELLRSFLRSYKTKFTIEETTKKIDRVFASFAGDVTIFIRPDVTGREILDYVFENYKGGFNDEYETTQVTYMAHVFKEGSREKILDKLRKLAREDVNRGIRESQPSFPKKTRITAMKNLSWGVRGITRQRFIKVVVYLEGIVSNKQEEEDIRKAARDALASFKASYKHDLWVMARYERVSSSPVSFRGISPKAGEKLFDMMPLTDGERSNIEVVTIEKGRGVLHERQAFVVRLGGRQLKVYLRPKTVMALEDAVKAGNSIENTIGEEFDRLDNEMTDIKIVLDEVRMAGEGVDVSSSPMTGDTFKKGGIDLNPALLDLQIKRDGNGVPLPLPMQPIENMHIEGFLPIIINVTPVTNLPFLLGLADTEQDADEITPAMKAREPEEISALN